MRATRVLMFDHMERREILPLKTPRLPSVGGAFFYLWSLSRLIGRIASAHCCMTGRLRPSKSSL